MPGSTKIASLAELIKPLAVEQFKLLLQDRKPHVQHGGHGDRLAVSIDWGTAIASLSDGTFLDTDIRLYRNRQKVPSLFFKGDPAVRAGLVQQMLATNAGFIVNRVERRVPGIASLCAVLAEESGDNVSAALVATVGEESALEAHFDPYDILVLQLDGAKCWEIFDGPVRNPIEGMNVFPTCAPTNPVMSTELAPGDWLFVPAGYYHRCETIAARFLHLSLLFYPLSLPRIVDLLQRELADDVAARAPLRANSARPDKREAEIKRALIDRIEAMTLDDLLDRHRRMPVAGD